MKVTVAETCSAHLHKYCFAADFAWGRNAFNYKGPLIFMDAGSQHLHEAGVAMKLFEYTVCTIMQCIQSQVNETNFPLQRN
jgi:hypothetical protein